MMNVLLVTVDCLRHDRVGYASGRGDLTPEIDRFSQDATVLTQAIAQGYTTWVSFASLFTSSYPRFQSGEWNRKPILSDHSTLAAILGEHGYATGGFHSNPWLSTHFGYGQEWDVYEDNLMPPAIRSLSSGSLRLAQTLHLLSPYLSGDKVAAQALNWIRQQDDPFFAWIHFMDAHGPYPVSRRIPSALGHVLGWRLYRKAQNQPEAVTPSEHQSMTDRYEAGIQYVDRVLGWLRGELASSGQLDNTLVIITADHGEAFREHGLYTHGHRHLYDEVIRVPLLIRWPGVETVPRVDGQVELTTIVPSVLEVLGLAVPPQVEGRSSVPWLLGDKPLSEPVNAEAISSSTINERYAVVCIRTEEWKYFLRKWMTKDKQESGLFHLEADPGEQDDCEDRYPDIVAWLNGLAEAHIQRLLDGASPDSAAEDIPEEVVSRLRALGYVD
jgi:arylsulfatase